MHTMREYYDLWPKVCAGLGRKGRLKEGIRRRLIHAADARLLSPTRIKRLFALSATVQHRLSTTLGLASEVLHPPLRPRPYRCDGYGDTFFVASRLTALKRIDLLLRALVEPAAQGLRVVIAGDGDQRDELVSMTKWLGVDDRVAFVGRVDEDELLSLYARCRAVVFTPLQEDYGFVAAEAFASAKPVITCTDSGGPTELVVHEANGLVVAPTAPAIAVAMRRLADDAALAERWGRAGESVAAAMTWDRAVQRLIVV
jgi:glycosyltransferase involved in cell wall biosynthesis